MKKLFLIFMVTILMFSISACNNNDENPSNTTPSTQSTNTINTNGKSLVVYFSWSGNTENVANSIKEQINSDIYEIIPATPYPNDYDETVDLAQQEQRDNARPEIENSSLDLSQYETIYIGYPNWWSDMPMIIYTFFDNYNLDGKTIAPFCTSGGSGLSDTVNKIKELEPNANVTEGLHIGSDEASSPDTYVQQWLESISQ